MPLISICKDKVFYQMPERPCAFAALLLGCLLLVNCSTVTTQSFRAPENSNVDASFIATDADFSKYSKLMAADMGIFFPLSVDLSEDEIQRIRKTFRDLFLAELKDYEIVDAAGPDVLLVVASLVDLRKAMSADVPGLRTELKSAARPGELLFMMELRDSRTERPLARAADGAAHPTFAHDGTDWTGVEEAAQHWASLFRAFLDQNLKQ
jgi:hypothetical protein